MQRTVKPPPPRGATLSDVAAAAGVSAMTASRVMNGRGGASEETKARVLAAATTLAYRPNTFARGLKGDRSFTVGIVVPDIGNPFFPEIIKGAELAARARGFTLLTCNVVEDPEREAEVLATLLDHRVDGVIVCSARLDDKRLQQAIEPHRAAVLINRPMSRRIAGTIEIDFRTGLAAATRLLIGRGRRRIAYIGGLATSYSGRMRRAGIIDALTEQGLELTLEEATTPNLEGGVAAARRLSETGTQIDAIICYNDLVAIGAMSVVHERGLAVPGDIAILGCDDILPARLVNPPLSTMHVAKQDLGDAAMRMLIDRIEGRSLQQSITIEPELIERGTT
jgi:LacI family transcriptional regulator